MYSSLRVVVVGATRSTLRTIRGLARNGANIACVFSLDPAASANVSGFATDSIASFCREQGISFQTFVNVNHPDIVEAVRNQTPDLLFAVGFSQLVGDELLSIPTKGAIGFHPTRLPAGRGRAPLAWLTSQSASGAATFFLMGRGADDGPILVQEPFNVSGDDHASEVENTILEAMDRALDRWLPRLLRGEWNPVAQDEAAASYFGIRRPEDGRINWDEPWQVTYARIRAASTPHPGAYTYANGRKIIVWRAEPATNMPWRGVPGRILLRCPERGLLVQAGDAPLWLKKLEDAQDPAVPVTLRVGQRLGYRVEDEVHKLRQEIEELKAKIEALQNVKQG